MGRLVVFNNVSLDGYFVGLNGDLSWAYQRNSDPEWKAFVEGNAKGKGMLLFGRVTYELMASYWPTPQATKFDPVVAAGMNTSPKVVFSRTLETASWVNTTLAKGNLAAEIRMLKKDAGQDMVILGSGSIVAQAAQEGLIDEYQIVVNPVVIGGGRTLFEGLKKNLKVKLIRTRAFANGNVLMCYEPVA